MGKRVTIIDIAARAGVHFTTVALALRGGLRVAPATREKILALAQEMNYAPDPMLSALSAYRRAQKPANYRETLAWVTSHPSRYAWKGGPFKLFYQGAEKRAGELGYRLEHFWLKEPGLNRSRAMEVLRHRGIRGLLVSPLPVAHGHVNLDWEHFSSVTFGFTVAQPRLHTVITSHYQDVVTAMRRLKALGYRRFGWANPRLIDERVGRQWKAGFWSEAHMLPRSRQIPVFSVEPFEKKGFLAWFQRFQPDSILTTENYADRIAQWLKDLDLSVPQDVSIVVVNIQEGGDTFFSGVKEASLQIGEAAVDLLTGLLREGKIGLPAYRFRLLIEGKWVDGQSTVRRSNTKRN